jgi:hypothetical protein
MVGAPNPDFAKGMRDEHCVKAGCKTKFTTGNYGVTTTPLKEYEISTGKRECAEADMQDRKGRRVRVIQSIEKLKRLQLCRKAKLTEDEILAVVSTRCRPAAIANGSHHDAAAQGVPQPLRCSSALSVCLMSVSGRPQIQRRLHSRCPSA